MGEINLKQLLKERKENYKYLGEQLNTLMEKHNERTLVSPHNKISIGATLTHLNDKVFKPNNIDATYFGSYLFHRRVSGTRVCAPSSKLQKFGKGVEFNNYGTHCLVYPAMPFFTSAASIGQSKSEIDLYIVRLDEAFKHFNSADPFGIFKKQLELEKKENEKENEEEKKEN